MANAPGNTDALIIGGGPAGLAAAIALRQQGVECLVVDALTPPIEKGCGEGLMPDTLHALAELGVTLTAKEGYPFEGIRFIDSSHRVHASFPGGTGIGVRRTHLHRRMHEQAQAAGARFAWGSHARLTDDGKVTLDGVEMRFGWLVGADGTASQVRRWAGLDAPRELSQRFGFRRHYRVAPWSNHVEIYWGATGQVYVTPVAPDEICLVFMTRAQRAGRENFLDAFPEVTQKLHGAAMVTPQRAAISATRRLQRVAHHAVALIGDASGSVDAITGEGLAMTFRQATTLAASIAQGNLDSYSQAHLAIGKLPHAMSRLMLLMDRWPVLQRHGMRALASNRTLFEELLSVHVGEESLQRILLRRAPSFGWSLLAGSRQG